MANLLDETGQTFLFDESVGIIADEAGIVLKMGSWWQLLDIRKQAQEEFAWWADNGPFACPQCGQPLLNAPPTESGSSVERYCPYDGWQFPRDWIRPEKL